jgi:hypothetical protein
VILGALCGENRGGGRFEETIGFVATLTTAPAHFDALSQQDVSLIFPYHEKPHGFALTHRWLEQ